MTVFEATKRDEALSSREIPRSFGCAGSTFPCIRKEEPSVAPKEMTLRDFKVFCIRRIPHLMAQELRRRHLWRPRSGLDRHVHEQVGRFLDGWAHGLWEGRFRKLLDSPEPSAAREAIARDTALWLLEHLDLADRDDASAVFGSYRRFTERLRAKREGGR